MTQEITIQAVGDSMTATIPREMLDRLNVKPGERMLAVETEGGILLTPFSDEHERIMAAYERGSQRYRDALRELSKK
jgi:putative addiction module antidote